MSKILENKVTRLMASENEALKYSDLLLIVMSAPIKEGITILEMKRDLKIAGLLESGKTEEQIEFTDDEFKSLVELVKVQKWQMRHPDIVDFAEYITSL